MCSSVSDSESKEFHPDDEPEDDPVSSINEPTSDDEVEIVEPVLRVLYIGEEAVDWDKCTLESRSESVQAVELKSEDVDETRGREGRGFDSTEGSIICCACTLARPALTTLSTARALIDTRCA